MPDLRIKMCGLMHPADAEAAEAAGANAVGVILVPGTKRGLDAAQARAVLAVSSALIVRVGVFRNAPLDALLRLAASLRLGAVQLHGHEGPDYVAAVARWYPVLLARAVGEVDMASLPSDITPLFDGVEPGSGRVADWPLLARQMAAQPELARRPWLLAGGLHPGNVAAAVAALSPWGVDVSSGIEDPPGHKSPARMQAFVAAVRGGR
jgi:phosphoribosylanthranilate isomerase